MMIANAVMPDTTQPTPLNIGRRNTHNTNPEDRHASLRFLLVKKLDSQTKAHVFVLCILKYQSYSVSLHYKA